MTDIHYADAFLVMAAGISSSVLMLLLIFWMDKRARLKQFNELRQRTRHG